MYRPVEARFLFVSPQTKSKVERLIVEVSSSHTYTHTHTHTHTLTLGGIPLKERSARRRGRYLNKHAAHARDEHSFAQAVSNP